MADIQKLTYPFFTDGTTPLNASNLNQIVAKINELVDKVTGGVTPTQTVATPTISISGSTATISCETSGATIYYTTNGNTPTTSSTQYSSPITLSGACTIKAIAVKSGMTNSAVASQPYSPASPVAVPTVTAAGKTITISAESGATIKYTLDGTTPSSSNGQTYSEPFELTASSGSGSYQAKYECTLKVVAIKNGLTSQVLTHTQTALTHSDTIEGYRIIAADSLSSGSPVFGTSSSSNLAFYALNQSKKYNIFYGQSMPTSIGLWAYTNQKTSDSSQLSNITGSYVCSERTQQTDGFSETVLPNSYPYICMSVKFVSGQGTAVDGRYVFINEITETIS